MATRKVMQFLVPTSTTALGRDDLIDRTIIPVYLNPENIKIQENKIINKSLTKGGFVVQYWGEELPTIDASGTTGSGGIEAINILRSVYRHEQTQFKLLLDARAQDLSNEAQSALLNNSTATAQAGLVDVLDTITGGGFSGIVDGISSTIEAITNAALGITENNPKKVDLIPSIGAFALSIDLYFQGEKFRGYFENFSVDENASSPGIFNYSFTFKVLKRSGERKNFMPWHRTPFDSSGNPTTASVPIEGARLDELTVPTTVQEPSTTSSTFLADQGAVINPQDGIQVPLNRNNIIKGK